MNRITVARPPAAVPGEEEGSCRVCQGPGCLEGVGERLLSPCLCKGSVRFVHRSCLDRWRLQGADRAERATRCELCGFEYRYEVQWISRSRRTWQLLALSLVGLAAALSLVRLLEGQLGGTRASAAVGTALATWALADLLPWRLGSHVLERALREVVGSSFPEGLERAEAAAQAKAAAHVVVAAKALARAQGLPCSIGQPSPGAEALPQDGEALVEGSSGYPARTRLCKPSRCLRSLCVVLASAAGIACYLWYLRKLWTGGGPSVCTLWSLSSAMGATYWLLGMVLALLQADSGVPQCEPVRGRNGFYMVRSLRPEERAKLTPKAAQLT